MAAWNSGSGLARDIAVLIVIKLVVLYGIYRMWFDEPVSEQFRVDALSQRVYKPESPQPESPQLPRGSGTP